jgi:colanic acid/amylovoran biosynthesis glycosyltransferase
LSHRPQRVLHVCAELLHRTETFIQQRLVGEQFQSVAMAWRRVEDGLDLPCPSVILSETWWVTRWLARALGSFGRLLGEHAQTLRAIHACRPDVVHAHFGHVAIRVDRECRLLGIPLVASFYGHDASSAWNDPALRRGYSRLFASATTITAEGPVLARRLKAIGARPETVRLLPLSLPAWALSRPVALADPMDPTLRLLQVARFTEKKGIETTLRALAHAHNSGASVRLVLAGAGPLRPQIEGLIADLQLSAVVECLGFIHHSSLPDHFKRAHALVQPSVTAANGDTEGGAPAVLIEAQAQGLPVLATTHADIPTVVRHGHNALLCAEGDHASLAANIVALASDRSLLARLAAAARPFVLRRHCPAKLLALRERIYRNAIRR